MTLSHIVILLITGAVGGFASGLLGIGGGIIMVPVQYLLFSHMGLTTDIAIRLGQKVKWDPAACQVVDDPEAERMLARSIRDPWRI